MEISKNLKTIKFFFLYGRKIIIYLNKLWQDNSNHYAILKHLPGEGK